ncbi:M48 family metallopeptidase [Nostoc sp. 'Peltigera membranacea cyanobiont' 210A]|uniref:M48 family metallopeptidase n=1 Tax=Nostoc sp. 'Peltigera membranacea cyanobiont' 210A TaxID=2014529 RepID=UPI00167E6283|nr:M48 family metallopeptidase [Nostoc sp. 'Peltigera membranacea cyanobiont' 210A]
MPNSFSFIYSRFYRRWLYLLLSVLVAVGIGVGSPQKTQAISLFDLLNQGIQIFQLSTISDREEVQLGKQINQQLVNSDIKLYRNQNVNRYVNQIGQWLATNSTRPDIPYTFQVVQDESVNAFATMGGYVYVTTGLLKAADNEAQLASVIAHEIGHIASRHSIEQMRETAIARGFATAAGLERSTAVQIGVDLALRRPHSRQDEFEADQRGLRTLGRSGYAQSAMIAFMQKLLQQPSVPTFLSTHPATSDRITALKSAANSQKAHRGGGLNNTVYEEKIQPLS